MSTYILGTCDTGWYPEFFTQTEDEVLLDDYCELQEIQYESDAVPAYELVSEDHPVNDLMFVPEETLKGFVQSLRNHFNQYVPGYDF